MSDRPFLRFINLVHIDQKIHSLEQKNEALDLSIDAINKQKNEYIFSLEEIQNKTFQLRKNVDFQELEMKVLDEKEREKRKFFDSIADYKEYQAAKNEIEAIQRLQINQEKAVLDAWSQLESMQSLFEKKNSENESIVQDYDAQVAKLVQEKAMILGELSDVKIQRDTHLIGIPQEWLDKYHLMGQRVADPVVPIEQQSCSGCYQQIITQDLVRARHGALLQCRKCFRLLYMSDAVEK